MSDGYTPTEDLAIGGETMDSLIVSAEIEQLTEEISKITTAKESGPAGIINQIRQESLEKDDQTVSTKAGSDQGIRSRFSDDQVIIVLQCYRGCKLWVSNGRRSG